MKSLKMHLDSPNLVLSPKEVQSVFDSLISGAPKKVTLIHFERSTRHHFRLDQLPTCPFVMAALTGACDGA